MGDFNAGRWVVILLLYFFAFFIVVNYFVQASIDYGVNNDEVQFADPGFGQSVTNILNQCIGSSSSAAIGFCALTLAADNVSCESLPSCDWNATTEVCNGFSATLCTSLSDETTCRLARCTWNTIDVPTQASIADKVSVSSIRTTVSFITGINAAQVKIGLPVAFIYIFSFIFFWIPFIMLAISFWFILPFLH